MTFDETYLTVDEYATLLRITPQTVRRLIRGGSLAVVKVGGQYRIAKSTIVSAPIDIGGTSKSDDQRAVAL
ncbi:MAG: helix-turn-helix domain-containing protein [Lacisediminihabitans sp.]